MSLWRRWTILTTAGELVGFVAPAVAGAGATAADRPCRTYCFSSQPDSSKDRSRHGSGLGVEGRTALLPLRTFALATGVRVLRTRWMLPALAGHRRVDGGDGIRQIKEAIEVQVRDY